MAKVDLDTPVHDSPLDGFRPCIAVVLFNERHEVLIAHRANQPGKPPWKHPWQFPQGGIEAGETPRSAAIRELHEETGIDEGVVELHAHAPDWLPYVIPKRGIQEGGGKYRLGQIQVWCLLELKVPSAEVDLAAALASSPDDEFDRLRWAYPAEAMNGVVPFKREVYCAGLLALGDLHMDESTLWDELRDAAMSH